MPSSSAPTDVGSPPAADLGAALAALGAPTVDVAGNAPRRLVPEGAAWLVAAGVVEVFAASGASSASGASAASEAAAAGAGAGGRPRSHLGTARPGMMLFGASPCAPGGGGGESAAGLELLAVGLPGSRLLAAGAEDLARLARDPAAAGALADAVEGWLTLLASGLPHTAPPQLFVELRPAAVPGHRETDAVDQSGASDASDEKHASDESHASGASEVELASGQVARPRGRAAWVEIRAGRAEVFGETAGGPGDGPGHAPAVAWPLPEAAWLVATEPVRLTVSSTRARLAGGDLWVGLARFHGLYLRHLGRELERGDAAERERLALRTARDRRLLAGAYGQLASVLLPAGPPRTAAGEETPLLAACRLVGQAQGIVIRDPATAAAGGRGDPLAAICTASRIERRRVILRGDWWRRDNGPLIGFLTTDGDGAERRPVALLPTAPDRYDLVDPTAPSERQRTPVGPRLADRLAGDAYMLYAPLPDRAVGIRDLLRFALRGRRRDLAAIVAMGIGGGLLALLLPVVTGQVFGNVIPGADRPRLLAMTLALIAGALAAGAFQVTRSIAVLRLGGRIDGGLQAAVWARLLSLPVEFFRRFTVGDLAVRSLGVDAIRDLLTGNVLTSFLALVFSLFSFALLFYYSWRLALVATGLIAVLMAVTAALIYLQLRHQRDVLELQGRLASLLFGLISGIDKLHLGGAEGRAFARWAEVFAEQRRRTVKAQRAANLQAAFGATYGLVTALALFAAVGGAAPAESLPVGDFLAFNTAFGQFLAAALAGLAILSSVLTLVPIYERLRPILATPPETDASKAEAPELAGAIELSHVSFRYQEDGPLILDEVSFHAAPGEFVALVGPSGAGKSTCLRLLLGFERPSSGSIYFDGQDLASLAIHSVRRQLGVVLQTGRPMVGDIFSNIVGSSQLSLDEAWEAARMAGLEEDIRSMPMGMHTVVSEGAGTFSGGQKQRLLIARAVVRRPRIILFDEATSALDNRTQQQVSESLARLKATRIVIAHRLSTIAGADRIYVMDGGRVIDSGTYRELLERGGLFARLAARQID
ncbi:MAG TPA: NHLP bacteriocin export ABC transporter permease/ATPase subunit [Thermoanaerobaculia bacterium]|jgi:ATP-binding cassette subfamily C protein|nr:NHLP bacteriocin export ABC transporter permease/ATPase subunit [Thermoanaerobaculia bacterium]